MSQRRIVEEVPAPVGLSSEIHLKRAVSESYPAALSQSKDEPVDLPPSQKRWRVSG